MYKQNNYSIEVSSLRSIQLSWIKYPWSAIEKEVLNYEFTKNKKKRRHVIQEIDT